MHILKYGLDGILQQQPRRVRERMVLKLYFALWSQGELACHPRARQQGLAGLAEILVASGDGMGFLWSAENTGHFGGSRESMPGWLHLFYCGHWVRLNFTPGIPQSHTVWFAVSLARVEVPFSSAHVGQGGESRGWRAGAS